MMASRFHACAAAKAVSGIGKAVFVQRAGDGNTRRHREQGCDNRTPDAAGQQHHHGRCETDPMPTTGKYFAQRDSQSGAISVSDDGKGMMVMNRSALRNSRLPFISDVSGQHVAEIGNIGQ